ncbi:BTAD domain-containing putative transcriptional regulator [Catenulispora pinisilvae]|uniref:BTAD domain-containing putative transcriptional regulator n=1 Tax=Catenulispora pinisilvae TaxID=2705253 RepID=UPI00189211B1|nr:BTAD domain-containing putative transcriptional regulator [Catenulispora pinisilvae]
MNFAARLVKAVAALMVTSTISVGVPWALLTWIGSPIPKHVPTLATVHQWMSTRLDIHVFIAIAVYLLWACWAVFVAQILVQVPGIVADLVRILRHREPLLREPAAGPGGALARGLIAAFTIAVLAPRGISVQAAAKASTGFVVGSSVRPVAVAPAVPGARAQLADAAPAPTFAMTASPAGTASAGVEESVSLSSTSASHAPVVTTAGVHVVVDGDSLWEIAAQSLGDGDRWRDIFRLNAGKQQPDGKTLSDPDLVLPGWRLRLPTISTSPMTDASVPTTKPTPSSSNTHGAHDAGATHAPRSVSSPATIEVPEADPVAPPVRLPIQVPAASTTTRSGLQAQTSTRYAVPAARIAPRDRAAVRLPGGGLVPITLASGVTAALALARLRSRARARISPVNESGEAEPLVLPPAEAPATMQRAHHATLCGPGIGLFQDDEDFGDDPYLDGAAEESDPHPESDGQEAAWAIAAEPCDSGRKPMFAPSLHGILVSLEAPDGIHFAVRDNIPIALSAIGEQGLGLIGAGAADAARAVLLCALAAGGPRVLDQAGEIHTTVSVWKALLGDIAVPDTGRLTIHESLAALLDDAVTEQTARAAEITEYGHTSAANVRRFENIHPFHPCVLLLEPEADERQRLEQLAGAAAVADMHMVLLGSWAAGMTVDVAADHSLTATGENAAVVSGAAVYGVSVEEAEQVLAVLNRSWTSPSSREPFTDNGELDGHAPAPFPQEDPDEDAPEPVGTPRLVALPTVHHVTAGPGVLALNVMGPFTAEIDGRGVTAHFQPAHRTLLLYLALQKRPAPRAEAMNTLWVDEDLADEKAKQKRKTRFDSRLYQTRKALTAAAGRETELIQVDRTSGLVGLNRAEVLTDLSCFDQLKDRATMAGTDEEKIAHLEAACALYRGPLDETIRGDWLLEHREDRLRRYRDAAGDLARLVSRTDPDQGLAILNTLLEHDLFNEDLYRRIMRGQARLGRLDAARRTFNLLETRFEAIDMQIDPSTRTLIHSLTRRSAA